MHQLSSNNSIFNGVLDLHAHNEITVNAGCETVFANIVDAQSWPMGFPASLLFCLASPTGFEPVGLQNGRLIPKYLGCANH
jgi:hypothetical protein